MAYMKYKELTKYFNFKEEIDQKFLPKYNKDYLYANEEIYAAYRTKRDKAVFTNERMILFDVSYFMGKTKKIHIIPYKSISTSAVLFNHVTGAILLSLDSGYQVRLNFVGLDAASKTRLRLLYCYIMDKVKK